jgi:hypothetical protein
MNATVKKEWLHELRTGSYKKGKYGLRDIEDYYDAAGILCELAVRHNIIDPPTKYDGSDPDKPNVFFGYAYDGLATGLSDAVCSWAGVSYGQVFSMCVKADRGWSFNKVADYIEKEF